MTRTGSNFMKRIAVFASGSGTNAENIIRHFQKSEVAVVVRVLTNNKDAKVLQRTKNLNINTFVFDRKDFVEEDTVFQLLKGEADFIVLAGFLWKVPPKIIEAFPQKIINIHPALLPKYGGKGMYGMHVHEAVKENNEKETGITIHYVNEQYDQGAVIFQKSVAVADVDTAAMIAAKVHELEHAYFPKVIEELLLKHEQ